MADVIASLPPVSTNVVNLAYADLVIYGLMLPPAIWITWKHGKSGMVCWPIFVSYFGLRFVADIYQIIHRHEPLIPNVVVIMTDAGGIACLTLTLIGAVYESNIILPRHPKRWTEKIILGVTHLCNTGGIAVATYGGSPTATGGVVSTSLNQIGNCMMLFTLFGVCYWMWPTYRRIRSLQSHPNSSRALKMIRCSFVAMPFQLLRLAYNTTYAFTRLASLDPVTGTFATKLLLVFGLQLGVALAMLTCGWLGMEAKWKDKMAVETAVEPSIELMPSELSDSTREPPHEADSRILDREWTEESQTAKYTYR